MQIAFPFRVSSHGRLASAVYEEHVVQLMEQLLFTIPGERVNRPDLGCGVMELVFDPAGEQLASATQFLILGSLQRYLGDLIQVESVQVTGEESTLSITIVYLLRQTQERHVARFQR